MDRHPIDYVSRAVAVQRQRGVAGLARRGTRFATSRVGWVKQRVVGELKREYNSRGQTDADPRAVEWVDLSEIEHVLATRLEPRNAGRHFELVHRPDAVQFAEYGDIVAGEWDRERAPITGYSEWDLVFGRFVQGRDWEKIPVYEDCRERLRRGEQIWGCASESELLDRFAYLERLKESIESRGYRRTSDLEESTGTRSAWPDEPDEVVVDIGRDGELLHYSNGRHRLALANVCDVDEIAVLVRARHEKWQAVREQILSADSYEQLSDRSKRNLDHPDLRDIVPDRWHA